MSGFFFKSVVQAVFLFGSETWVVNPCMVRALGGFQDQVAIRLAGRLLRRKPDGEWTYTSALKASKDAGFQTMEEYIQRHQNTVAQYIAT